VKNKKKGNKPTVGELPDRQKEFENTTWHQKENKAAGGTEAERMNVSKTLPETACKEDEKKPSK
jgi:hypothetical protein